VQSAREAARRIACINNQKQVALAVLGHHDAKKEFPTGVGFTEEARDCAPGTGRYVWTFRILPYMEMANLAEMIHPRSSNGWYRGPDNASTVAAFQTRVSAYQCPSDTHARVTLDVFRWQEYSRSNYVGCFSPHGFQVEPEANETCLINGAMNGGQKTAANPTVLSESPSISRPGRSIFNFFGVRRTMTKVTDGTTKTVLISEVISGIDADFRGTWWLDQGVGYSHWRTPNSPQNDRVGDAPGNSDYSSPKPGLPGWTSGPGGWGGWMVAARSRHPGGVIAAYADGSVRFINEAIASDVWMSLGSMNGGEGPLAE